MRKYFLRSERLGFRRWTIEDLPLAVSLWGDPEVMRMIDARGGLTEAEVHERLESEIRSEAEIDVQYWPVFLLDGSVFAGCCGLRPCTGEARGFELGFHVRSALWGKGYASEAARAVIPYAFDILSVDTLYAGHHPGNVVSRHILQRLGFSASGTEYYAPTGLEHPSYILTHDRWMTLTAA